MTAKKISILFVDDEIKVLSGLKRSLRSKRDQWAMSFANSGSEALELLKKRDIDLIISDMYMPGMDGGTLLHEIRTHHPQTIRTILSGHSDKALILKTLKPAHKFLHKPCPPEKITQWVNKILFFRKILPNRELQDVLNGIGALPSQPLFFPLLFEAIAQDKPQEVGRAVGFDVSMAANILKVTLNSFFVESERLPSLSDAASLLGLDLLYEIISARDLFVEYNTTIFPDFSIDLLWRHCLRTANYARIVASLESTDKTFINKCYLAGLFHDLGKFLLTNYYTYDYLALLSQLPKAQKPLEQLELANLNCSHALAGAYLMGLWGLPLDVVEAIAFHERPSVLKKYTLSPLTIVHVANVLDHLFLRFSNQDPLQKLDLTFLSKCMTKDKLQTWKKACKNFFNKKIQKLSSFTW